METTLEKMAQERRIKRNANQREWRRNNPIYRASKIKYYRKHTYAPPASRRRWTPKEDALVLGHHYEDSFLAKELKRTIQAIHVRRCKLISKFNQGGLTL